MTTVLVAEEEYEIRNYLKLALSCYNLKLEFAQTCEELIARLRQDGERTSLLLLDTLMSNSDDRDLLEQVRQICPTLPVILLSGISCPIASDVSRLNSTVALLPKPISHQDLRDAIEQTLPMCRNGRAVFDYELGDSPENYAPLTSTWSQKLNTLLQRVGGSDVPVLLQGETGVGKEVVARKLHARSKRANRPFLKLNCAALPSELVESELFGYEKGAFTGAFKTTPGKFEMANRGTILLDEIGDMDFRLQAKLLQVLQDNEFLRLGAKETSRVDVRIMAASHCNFERAIVEKRFREDLYYRLNIVDINIPALRERREEILPLADFFLQKHATPESPALEMTAGLRQALLDHYWPGNVRELENVMRKYLVLRNPSVLAAELVQRNERLNGVFAIRPLSPNLPRTQPEVLNTFSSVPSVNELLPPIPPILSPLDAPQNKWLSAPLDGCELEPVSAIHPRSIEAARSTVESALSKVEDARKAAESEAILNALNSSLWNRKQAALLLQIDYKALLYKMKKLGIGEKRAASG